MVLTTLRKFKEKKNIISYLFGWLIIWDSAVCLPSKELFPTLPLGRVVPIYTHGHCFLKLLNGKGDQLHIQPKNIYWGPTGCWALFQVPEVCERIKSRSLFWRLPVSNPSSLQGWLMLHVACRGIVYVRWQWHAVMAATQFFLPPVSLWRLPSISSMEFLWGNVILPSLKGRQREKHQIPDVTGHRGLVLVVCKEQRYRVSVVTLLCFGQRQPQMLLQGKAWEPEVCRRKQKPQMLLLQKTLEPQRSTFLFQLFNFRNPFLGWFS